MEDKLYLSQSMLKDWEKMCPLAFSKKWFGSPEEKALFSIDDSQAVRFGVHFETLAIGSGMGGKTIEWTEKEKKSVYYERIKRQAKKCRDYLAHLGGKILAVQDYVQTPLHHAGETIFIQGNIDVRYGFKDGVQAVQDLKSTGSTDNTFGPFQWGALDRIDVTQLIHYKILVREKYGVDPEAYYLVFDISAHERFVAIKVDISEWAIEDHKDRLVRAYKEINESIILDYWEPKNTYENCNACPLSDTCPFANKFPEIVTIER